MVADLLQMLMQVQSKMTDSGNEGLSSQRSFFRYFYPNNIYTNISNPSLLDLIFILMSTTNMIPNRGIWKRELAIVWWMQSFGGPQCSPYSLIWFASNFWYGTLLHTFYCTLGWAGASLELVIMRTSWIIKEDVYIKFIVIALRDSDNERFWKTF